MPDFDDPSALPDGGSTGTGTILDDRPETSEVEPGDHERFAHYVRKDKVVESAVMGSAVVALCGKVWVPTRDPKKFPVCPDCKAIYEGLPQGGQGDSSGSGGSGSGNSGGES